MDSPWVDGPPDPACDDCGTAACLNLLGDSSAETLVCCTCRGIEASRHCDLCGLAGCSLSKGSLEVRVEIRRKRT